MAKVNMIVEIDTEGALKELAEIKELADELRSKIFRFSVEASAVESRPSSNKEKPQVGIDPDSDFGRELKHYNAVLEQMTDEIRGGLQEGSRRKASTACK